MRANIGWRRLALGLAASLGLLVPGPGHATTVDASSTTMLIVREQLRAGDSVTIAPAYEILSVSARDVANPIADNLQLVFQGWGAGAIGRHLVWYDTNRPTNRIFGDLDLAYLQGDVLGRTVQLRLGRQLVAGGVAGSMQLDGGNLLLRLPYGFGLSGFVGSPVSQRFDDRGGEATFNPDRGNFTAGGRAYWVLPRWGELGASVVTVEDSGDPSRRQVGADLRLVPWRSLVLLANTSYDFYEDRWAETNVVGQYQLLRALFVTADYRHVEPDLLLARNSILAVFAVDRRNEVGGGAQYDLSRSVAVTGDYHFLKQEGGNGHRARAGVTWRPRRDTTAGGELSGLRGPGNDYLGVRAFVSRKVNRFTGTLDVQNYLFDDPVNGPGSGRRDSFLATATVGYGLGRGFSALVSGSGGATPYYQSQFDVMAKLAYNQTYQMREVR